MRSGAWGPRSSFVPQMHTSSPLRQCRKNAATKVATGAPSQKWRMGKSLERCGVRIFRLVSNKRTGILGAILIVFVSLLMLANYVELVSSPFKRLTSFSFRDGRKVFGSPWKQPLWDGVSHKEVWMLRELSSNKIPENSSAAWSLLILTNGTLPKDTGSVMKTFLSHDKGLDPQHHNGGELRTSSPVNISSPPLRPWHPCASFKVPPPPADKKRIGPRPCPVCYLSAKEALKEMPGSKFESSHILKHLSYIHHPDEIEGITPVTGTDFGGHQTLTQREKSFHIQESMHVHCGFTRGVRPGVGSGFEFDEIDELDMSRCQGIVVASAIFGNYDVLQQPRNIGEEAKIKVCFFMFVDGETAAYLSTADFDQNTRKIGLWRIVVVHNLPFQDARRNGKVPKLLIHRLFPNARFSLWVDGKLELVVDPYQILERFLWRSNDSFAISKHYRRFDVYTEAEANKAAKKYDNASIDAQVEFYRREGLTPYSSSKLPIVSDVPEGCVIIREHAPITNLFGCLWFNEVDRFTSRDQLSFAIVRDKIRAQISWRVNMFLDCERRNFVQQTYHKDLLELLSNQTPPKETLPSMRISDTRVKHTEQPHKNRKTLPSRKKTGKRKRGAKD